MIVGRKHEVIHPFPNHRTMHVALTEYFATKVATAPAQPAQLKTKLSAQLAIHVAGALSDSTLANSATEPMNYTIVRKGNGAAHVAISGVVLGSPYGFFEELGSPSRIELLLDCLGGVASTAFEICDRLKQFPVTCTVKTAHSAGVILMSAGETIRAFSDTSIMIHGPARATFGGRQDHIEGIENLNEIVVRYRAVLCQRFGLPFDTFNDWLSGPDKYFTAHEALRAGLIDILLPWTAAEDRPRE
jgi:ATP-dependent protease ClpP protease subunit